MKIYQVDSVCDDSIDLIIDTLYIASTFELAKKFAESYEAKKLKFKKINDTYWKYEKDYESSIGIMEVKVDDIYPWEEE